MTAEGTYRVIVERDPLPQACCGDTCLLRKLADTFGSNPGLTLSGSRSAARSSLIAKWPTGLPSSTHS